MKNEENKISRRAVIGGLGVGLAAVAASPVLATSPQGFSGLSGTAGLEDPTTGAKRDPCKWGGTWSDMDAIAGEWWRDDGKTKELWW